MPARKGARSARSAAAERGTVTCRKSVLAVAAPRPGKCLSVGATRPARQPRTAAATAAAAAGAREPKDRLATADLDPAATSATGARATVTPAWRRSREPARAVAPTVPP